jgi:hypothetical protein
MHRLQLSSGGLGRKRLSWLSSKTLEGLSSPKGAPSRLGATARSRRLRRICRRSLRQPRPDHLFQLSDEQQTLPPDFYV